jgi:hypothetical protein
VYYLPVLVFLLWSLYGLRALPDWRNARYVRNPRRTLWAFWQVLGDREWTEEGRRLRRAYYRHLATGVLLASLAFMIVAAIEGG